MKEGLLCIQFDDGFKTDLTVAMQEQLDRGMTPKGTSYVIPTYTSDVRLTPEEEQLMIQNGWDIQCHSNTHTVGGPQGGMTGLTATQLHEEMNAVNIYFNDVLGVPSPDHHAFPGAASNKLMRDVMGRYRKTLRAGQGRFCDPRANRLEIPAFSFDYNPDRLEYIKKVINMCVKHGLYAIIFAHELATENDIAQYKAILDHVQETKIRLVTITELYNEVLK